ncbi:hypothetical protein ACJJTC_005474 [Scirpophaga incertulas]
MPAPPAHLIYNAASDDVTPRTPPANPFVSSSQFQTYSSYITHSAETLDYFRTACNPVFPHIRLKNQSKWMQILCHESRLDRRRSMIVSRKAKAEDGAGQRSDEQRTMKDGLTHVVNCDVSADKRLGHDARHLLSL